MPLQVQKRMCDTCIYRPDSVLDIARLEEQIADPHMEGHYKGFRVCHHTDSDSGIVCRGFWNQHKDDFDLGQLAQRMNKVEFVEIDNWKDSE